ncbi:hypothetical protein BRADI_1g37500v3 [Brachypodium distachyon]|nr:hypothetical protein BRADI_1g37500v3 [Brachypodium distachyon]
MEVLPPAEILPTLAEMKARTPKPMRIAYAIRYGRLPASAAAGREDVARCVAALARTYEPDMDDLMEFPEVALKLQPGSCYLRDHDEDAHFIRADPGVIGVADGVGSWRAKGVDAAAFSRALMANARAQVDSAVPGTPVCPYKLLERAYEQTVAASTPGSSTAVIVSLSGRVLRWAYVGDSGFALFRRGRMVHRSQPQQASFNCPYQLGAWGNKVGEAAVGQIAVKDGDVLVVGSDGLFDNLFDSAIQQIVRMCGELKFSPKMVADILAGNAYCNARSNQDSPFSAASRQQQGTSFTGGKQDDITVVVAYIVS